MKFVNEFGPIVATQVAENPANEISSESQSELDGRTLVGDWERTYIASACRKKRFRPFFAMQTCPQPTRTISRAQRMTHEQRRLG